MQIPLINEHLFCKYFVRLSVGNATKLCYIWMFSSCLVIKAMKVYDWLRMLANNAIFLPRMLVNLRGDAAALRKIFGCPQDRQEDQNKVDEWDVLRLG